MLMDGLVNGDMALMDSLDLLVEVACGEDKKEDEDEEEGGDDQDA